jgi:hypothetical protein
MMRVRYGLLAAFALSVAMHAHAQTVSQLTRFGIRNEGSVFDVAGGDPNLASLVFPGDGTVIVQLVAPYVPGTSSITLPDGTNMMASEIAAPVTQLDGYYLQFMVPNINQNDVLVFTVNGTPSVANNGAN